MSKAKRNYVAHCVLEGTDTTVDLAMKDMSSEAAARKAAQAHLDMQRPAKPWKVVRVEVDDYVGPHLARAKTR